MEQSTHFHLTKMALEGKIFSHEYRLMAKEFVFL